MAARGWRVTASAVFLPLALGACTSGRSSVGSTALVERATITDQVSSSGAVSAAASENLGFAKGGRLTSLRVRVGDHVTAGQVLAKIDTYAARQVLRQQRANLAAQQAALDRIIANPAVSGASATLTQSQVVLTATRRQARAVRVSDDSAITRAGAQLRAARHTEAKADDAVDAAQDACKVPGTPPATCAAQVANASSAQASAQQGVEAAKTAVVAAEQKKKVDSAAGQVSVETSKQAVVTAQNALNTASSDRPHAIDLQIPGPRPTSYDRHSPGSRGAKVARVGQPQHRCILTIAGAEHGLAGADQEVVRAAYRSAAEFLHKYLNSN